MAMEICPHTVSLRRSRVSQSFEREKLPIIIIINMGYQVPARNHQLYIQQLYSSTVVHVIITVHCM